MLTSASQLQSFEGGGAVTLSAHAGSRSTVSGPGNLVSQLNATAGAQVQVIYHYIPSNALRPGAYTIVQPSTPAGYLPGLKSSGGVVIPNSVPTNRINVTLQTADSTNNNFAEVKPSSLSGHVYLDLNNDGARQANEPPIAGVVVTLTGRNDLGVIAALTAVTATDGSYTFGNLRPGTYAITKSPPRGYANGKPNQPGTLNGVPTGTAVSSAQFTVTIGAPNQAGLNYDFAEVLAPATPQVVTPPPTAGKAYMTGYAAYLRAHGLI
jgi:hypothetical protein